MSHPLRSLFFASSVMLVCGGCLSPNAVQWPSCFFPTKEAQRRAAQIQDPYPSSNAGPSVGFRPLEYQKQRAEPQEARDRYYSGFLKSHFGGPQPVPQTSAAPMLGPAPRYAAPANAPQYAVPMTAPQQFASPLPPQQMATPIYSVPAYPTQSGYSQVPGSYYPGVVQ